MAKNVSPGQGLFDDLNFANPSSGPVQGISRKETSETRQDIKPEIIIRDEWKSKMTVKKSVYLTQRVSEALALRHAGSAKTDRDFSKTVNAALENFLAEEIMALEDASRQHLNDEQARYRQALTTIMAERLRK